MAIVIIAGLKESGVEGAARERALVEFARSHGTRLVGPNCPGVLVQTLTDRDARELVRSVRGFPLLDGSARRADTTADVRSRLTAE